MSADRAERETMSLEKATISNMWEMAALVTHPSRTIGWGSRDGTVGGEGDDALTMSKAHHHIRQGEGLARKITVCSRDITRKLIIMMEVE
jgi:hypothetical protein